MRLALVVLVLAGACRLRFDEVADREDPDAGTAHDEDGDGIADDSDPCPHIAGTEADADGDGVGDACDPEPSTARQSWELFEPFVTGDGFMVASGTWLETGDSLRCDTSSVFGELKRALAFTDGVLELGVDILSRTDASPQHQVSFAVMDVPTLPYYYAEVYDVGPMMGYAAISHYDGMLFSPIAQVALASGVHAGAFTLRFTVASPRLGMTAAWPAEPYTAMLEDATDYAGGPRLGIGAQGLVLELKYLAVIATR